MKRQINYLIMITSLVLLAPVYGAQAPKPSTWQKFKSVFSSKKTEEKDLNQLTEPQKKGFLDSLSNFKTDATKFNTFSRQQIKMIEVKVKTLELVQERLTKISKGQSWVSKLFWKEKDASAQIEQEKINLAGQLGRLRADLFMTLVEIFQEMKPTLISIKDVMQRGLFKDVTVFDKMLELCNALIVQGSNIGEKLLRASDAYGKRDAIDKVNKEVEILINDYIKSAIKIMAMTQPAAVALKSALSVVRSMAWVTNKITLGGITSLAMVFELFDKIVSAGKIAADLSKDIFVQIIEKNGIKSVEAKLDSVDKELERTIKKIEEATDTNNPEDFLNLDDLMQKNK